MNRTLHGRGAEREGMSEDLRLERDRLKKELRGAMERERAASRARDAARSEIAGIGGRLALTEHLLASAHLNQSSVPKVPDPATDEGKVVGEDRVKPAKKPVADIIIEALAKAGKNGVPARELTLLIAESYSVDASEKGKARLRKAGLIVTKRSTRMWYLPVHAPEGCE